MTDSFHPNDGPERSELQFDNAEYASSTPNVLTCSTCQEEISDSYFEINGKPICPTCREAIEAHLRSGSRVLRFSLASVYGGAAAVGAFLLSLAMVRITGKYYGFFSIIVGLLVGSAVRAGSSRRGGWVYQVLAVILTYFAVGLGFAAHSAPEFIAAMKKAEKDANDRKAPAAKNLADHKQKPAAPDVAGDKNAAKAKAGDAQKLKLPPAAPNDEPLTPAMVIIGIILICVLAMFYILWCPLGVAISSPFNFFILAFALWEAWKMNRRPPLVFHGPFQFAPSDAPLYAEDPADE